MASIPGLLPVANSANIASGDVACNSEDSSKGPSSITSDKVGVTPVVMSPPLLEAIDQEGQAGDDTESDVESNFHGMCLAIPFFESATSIPDGAGGAVLIQEDQLWENGATITYGFMPRSSTRHEWGEDKVHEVVKEWSKYANINFLHVPDAENALVRITFDRSNGSWSLTGKKSIEEPPTDEPTMNLGGVEKISKMQATDVGTILHEFGHVLGLKHEHQSPSRGGVFKMNEQFTIEAYQKIHNWSPELIKEQILDVYNNEAVGNYTDLDLTSVMMYFMPAAQNNMGIEIQPNNHLSDYDKAFMLIHYPYFGFEPQADGWNFTKALDVFGIKDADRVEMMDLYGAGNVRDVRRHFAVVYERVRAQRNAALASDVAARASVPA